MSSASCSAAYAQAADDAQFVVLEGDPGIGKTRLADELAAVAAGRGSLAVWARADELGADAGVVAVARRRCGR